MINIDNIHFIKDKIYKKNIIKINFERKTIKNEITKLNLLSHILLNTSKKYGTQRKLIRETKELYDLSLESFVGNYGNVTILSFRFSFLRDEYSDINNGLKSIDFIKELILNPDCQNQKFNLKALKQAKDEVKLEIETEKENKGAYSKKRMIEFMDSDSPANINIHGYLSDLKKITAKNLYEFYLEVIKNSKIDVFSFGTIDESYFSFLENKNMMKLDFIYKSKENNVKTKIEKDNINQSRLVLGFNLNDLSQDEATYPLQIYLYLLGQGPNSKLFTEVREKSSLCYSISVSAKAVYSIMIITAGIDAKNTKKAIELINKQVEELKNGNFNKKDIESAKLTIKTSYQEILENPYAIITSYESHVYLGYDLIKNRFEKIDKVKYDDILKVANKVKLNTIYLLEGKKK